MGLFLATSQKAEAPESTGERNTPTEEEEAQLIPHPLITTLLLLLPTAPPLLVNAARAFVTNPKLHLLNTRMVPYPSFPASIHHFF